MKKIFIYVLIWTLMLTASPLMFIESGIKNYPFFYEMKKVYDLNRFFAGL